MAEREKSSIEPTDGFLQRWSRRKRGVAAGTVSPDETRVVETARDVDAVGLANEAAAEDADVRLEAPLGRGRMIVEPEMLYPTRDDEGEADGERSGTDSAEAEGCEPVAEKAAPRGPVTAEELAELEAIDIDALDYNADYTQFMRAGVPEALKRRALRKLWGSNPILANLDGMNDYDEDFTDAKLAVEVLQSVFKPVGGYMTEEEIAAQERLGREHEYDEDGNWIGDRTDVAANDQGDVEDAESAEGESVAAAPSEASAEPKVAKPADADDEDDDVDDDGDTEFA